MLNLVTFTIIVLKVISILTSNCLTVSDLSYVIYLWWSAYLFFIIMDFLFVSFYYEIKETRHILFG